jgi:hypothetical protein
MPLRSPLRRARVSPIGPAAHFWMALRQRYRGEGAASSRASRRVGSELQQDRSQRQPLVRGQIPAELFKVDFVVVIKGQVRFLVLDLLLLFHPRFGACVSSVPRGGQAQRPSCFFRASRMFFCTLEAISGGPTGFLIPFYPFKVGPSEVWPVEALFTGAKKRALWPQ